MRFDTPLDDVFLNRSHARVLRALQKLPKGFPASGRELARRARVTHPTALKALARLAEVGLVRASKGVAGDLYELNEDHALARPIANLYIAETDIALGLTAFLEEQLLGLTNKVESATVFGSAVGGDSRPGSDIDLAVCCAPADLEEVERALAELSSLVGRRFGNHLSPVIQTGKKKRGRGIWKRIEEEGVPLIRCGKGAGR